VPVVERTDCQPAGLAFTVGSPKLAALALYPSGIPVRAIAGAVTLQTGIGLWQNPQPVGDFVVSVNSQLPACGPAGD
jgi:hypothetical protein